MRRFCLAALAALAPSLAAAGSLGDAIHGPRMGPMAYPTALVGATQPVLASAREPLPEPPTANSLWRVGARTRQSLLDHFGSLRPLFVETPKQAHGLDHGKLFGELRILKLNPELLPKPRGIGSPILAKYLDIARIRFG